MQRYYANDTENATIFALERGTDLAVTNGGTGNFYGIYDPNYLKPSASQVGFMWRTMYQIIGKANEIIAAAEDLEDTPSLRDQTFVDTTDNLYHLNLPRDAAFESTESAYDLKEMHRIVNALPREYKIPFSMHVSGFKYREIAEKLGLPLGTVKSRIYFTRQKLQQDLKDFV